MDYHPERNTSLAVSKTPSFVYNNLTCNGTTVAYAHREETVTFSESTASGGQPPKETVLRPQLPPARSCRPGISLWPRLNPRCGNSS